MGGFHVASKHILYLKFQLYKTGISATHACGERHLVRAIIIMLSNKGWHSLSLINWNLSKTKHDANWLGIITNFISNHCPKHKDLLLQEDMKSKGHSRDSTVSFLSPQYLNTWSYEGLVADSWSSATPRYNKRAWRGPKVPFCTPLKVLLKAFHRKKGHGKDIVRNILRLEDKPMT